MPSRCYIKFFSPKLELDSNDEQLKLFWINKQIDVLHFKVMYTHNNWRDKEHIYVGKSKSSCLIPNILPGKTYRFNITSYLENSFECYPSEEVIYNSETPNPPNGLQVVVVNRTLTLNWTSPQLNMFKAETYKISYTCNDWEDNCEMIVNATNSSCIIPNVLPEKTYKFKIASCLQTSYVGKPSVEILYYSESPNPPIGLQVVVVDKRLTLIWTSPPVNIFIAKSYKISYTCNDWFHKWEKVVSATESSCIIPNILPETTYKFRIASCLNDTYEGKPSVETLYYSGPPNPPTQLDTFCGKRKLVLTWSSPVMDMFEVEHFKVVYTSNEWIDKEQIIVNANKSFCIIPNVLPLKTYRFTVASCLKNFDGPPSSEHMFKSGTTQPPNGFQVVVVDRTLSLLWTSPPVDIFIPEFYKISHTCNDWDERCDIIVNATESSCVIPNIVPDKTYKFRISSCIKQSNEGQSSLDILYCSGSPNPPTELHTFCDKGMLKLTWTFPTMDLFEVEHFKIVYTSNDWIDREQIKVNATESYCIIPNVRPLKTYRFTVASCLKNFNGQPSDEHIFKSGTPNPPNGLQVVVVDRKFTLVWTSPQVDIFSAESYKISYTCNDWYDKYDIIVNATESSCVIPIILPGKPYKFKISSCLKDSYEGKPSIETLYYSGLPNPPTELHTFPDKGMLTLTWTSPTMDLFEVEHFKILYTFNEWGQKEQIKVNANESYCTIPNILPLKTYRFTVASCLKNFDGPPSSEHIFQSDRPYQPPTLEIAFESGNIRLMWTSPEETLFRTDSYHLEVTSDDWKTNCTYSIHGGALEYVITDFKLSANYRFKLCTVSHSVKSAPTQLARKASPRYFVKVQLNGPSHEPVLQDKTSPQYLSLQEGIENGINTVFRDCPGKQIIAELDFSSGSLFAVFILISQGCYDDVKIRNSLEDAIKTGTFGFFKVSMEGFCFKALDNPVPPQIEHIEIIDATITISWSEPEKTFFKTTNFLLQKSTDNWNTYEEVFVSADQYKYCFSNTEPLTKYEFRILTCALGGIKSFPSENVYTVTKGLISDVSSGGIDDRSTVSVSATETKYAVEVSGMKETTSPYTIQFYFESKRGANCEVKDIRCVPNKKMYLLSFDENKDISVIFDKEHVVDGAVLHVEKHIPPKYYPNKALITGFNLKAYHSKDNVTNFFEARTRQDVESIQFGNQDSGTAIITFTEAVDIEQLQNSCRKGTFDGNPITVHQVEESNCIMVKGFSSKTTDGTIQFYFDTKKRSGVEGVVKTEMNTDQGYCIVYFKNAKDALAACEHSHSIEDCMVTVQIFYDSLGYPLKDDKLAFQMPHPVYITDIDTKKLKFLLNSPKSQLQLYEQLKVVNAVISWPTSCKDNQVQIECSLSNDEKNHQKLSKTWNSDVKEHINNFLMSLQVDRYLVAENVNTLLMDRLRELNLDKPDEVRVITEDQSSCEVFIVGYKKHVQILSGVIKDMIDDIRKDIYRKSKKIYDMISLKHHQLVLLELTYFADRLKNKYKGIDVQIDIKSNVLSFCGTAVDITAAKNDTYKTIKEIVSVCIGERSKHFILFLKRPDIEQKIYSKFKVGGHIGVLNLQNETINVCCMTSDGADTCAKIIKESVVEIFIELDNWQKHVIHSHKFGRYVEDLEIKYRQTARLVITENQNEIVIHCLSKTVGNLVHKKLSDFIFINGTQEKTYQLTVDDVKLLQELMKEETKKLEIELKHRNIFFLIRHDNIFVQGKGHAFVDALKEVESLLKYINYVTSYSKFKTVVEKFQGKAKLKQMDKDPNESSDAEVETPKHDSKNIIKGNVSLMCSFTTEGNKEVMVIKGDITQLDVDVIVNAAYRDLQHKRGLAKILVNKGGRGIQDECDQYITNHGLLSDGEVFCSKPGALNCKMIVHAVGPTWKGGKYNEEKCLVKCIETCLAVTEKNTFFSIAIPALCSGKFRYPQDMATNVIVETVNYYFRVHPSSCIQHVCLCDIVNETVKLFQKASNVHLAKDTTQGLSAVSDQEHVQVGSIEIKIIKGQLERMKVGAIVNTTSKDLKLNQGTVSASLLKHGGPSLQQECSQNYPNGISYGDIAVTSGGNLQCKIICHGCLHQWDKGGSGIQELQQFVMSCLSTSAKRECSSIAFPALGTGTLKYPVDLVAKSMYKCVEDFTLQNPNSRITEVLFVLYDKDYEAVKAFENEEYHRKEFCGIKGKDRILKGGVSSVVFSRLSDDEKLEVFQVAFAAKKHFEEELKETKDEIKKKEEELSQLQKQVSNRTLIMKGENEALDGNTVVYFDLYPEIDHTEGSADQAHFLLAETLFERLVSGSGKEFTVTKVQCVVNPPLVKQFYKAIDDMKIQRGEHLSYPVLAFHGTQEANIKSIIQNNFRVPGQEGFTYKTDTNYHSRGVYFSEYPGYSMGYIIGATHLLLCQVLPGNVYVPPTMIKGASLQQGYDSHMSPDKKELVIFNSHHILPFYIVHFTEKLLGGM